MVVEISHDRFLINSLVNRISDKKSLKSDSKWAYLVQNFSLIIFMKSILVYLVPPTHKLAKTAEKSSKWPYFGVNFLETGTEIGKTLQSKKPPLFDDSKTPFSLIPALMGFSKKCPF